MKRIPESINIVCYHLLKNIGKKTKITSEIVDEVIYEIVHNRKGRPQEFLSSLSINQARFLEILSKYTLIKKITAKKIQRETKLSSPGILKITAHFIDKGIIYKSKKGFEIADHFLELHLQRYGI